MLNSLRYWSPTGHHILPTVVSHVFRCHDTGACTSAIFSQECTDIHNIYVQHSILYDTLNFFVYVHVF